MAEFPALPLFTDAYLADTRHLTAEEHGAYLLLLMCAWRTRGCQLRDDDRTLARIVGVQPARWRKLRPVLADFFTVADGHWQQKKLNAVYDGVQERVAKNRENGAKGGRAKAARLASVRQKAGEITGKPTGQPSGQPSGHPSSEPAAKPQATKARVQTPEPKAAAGQGAAGLSAVAAAAGLDEKGLDGGAFHTWAAAGADLMADILPAITRLRGREEARSGRAPQHLNYYTAAVLEARDTRLGAVKAGARHAAAHPPALEKRPFDRASSADWRLLLGDAGNRFRGDYLSANWRIGPDHPEFQPAALGPDPRERLNPDIPADVFADYAPAFRWRRPG